MISRRCAAGRRRRLGAALLAALLAGAPLAAGAADAERGRALYEGRLPLGATDSPAPSACAACHRRSGLGLFEGGLAVPPIAGNTLFLPFDSNAATRFTAAANFRVRPAYDEASLAQLLRTGVTPDGTTLHPAMPRYAASRNDVDDLAAHLRGLSNRMAPGVGSSSLQLATITTPDADPARSAAMVAALRSFIERKNGESRHEPQRAKQATRTREMLMYRKFRVWTLAHWALQGEPESWAAQLDEWQARQPVYAVVGGVGRAQWAPIDAFCERHKLPCLLPLVEAGGGAAPGFYSVHYHAGIDMDVNLAARALKSRGVGTVELWVDPTAPELARRVRAQLARQGLRSVEERLGASPGEGAIATVSLLAPQAHLARLRARGATPAPLLWLPGTHPLRRNELDAALTLTDAGWIVTPMRVGESLERQLARSRAWLRSRGLDAAHDDVAAAALQAATALGEMLVHLDANFTPEYLLELLEHGLENMVPWSPYPRLAIGAQQRIASKGSWVGVVQAGQVDWQWQLAP